MKIKRAKTNTMKIFGITVARFSHWKIGWSTAYTQLALTCTPNGVGNKLQITTTVFMLGHIYHQSKSL